MLLSIAILFGMNAFFFLLFLWFYHLPLTTPLRQTFFPYEFTNYSLNTQTTHLIIFLAWILVLFNCFIISFSLWVFLFLASFDFSTFFVCFLFWATYGYCSALVACYFTPHQTHKPTDTTVICHHFIQLWFQKTHPTHQQQHPKHSPTPHAISLLTPPPQTFTTHNYFPINSFLLWLVVLFYTFYFLLSTQNQQIFRLALHPKPNKPHKPRFTFMKFILYVCCLNPTFYHLLAYHAPPIARSELKRFQLNTHSLNTFTWILLSQRTTRHDTYRIFSVDIRQLSCLFHPH